MPPLIGKLSGLIALTVLFGMSLDATLGTALADAISWRLEWPRTDFSKHNVPLGELKSGGPRKDGIPAIDAPRFDRLVGGKPAGWSAALGDTEPVIALSIEDDARAYPLRVLIWHEIANDTVGGTPVTVTYCPLSTPRSCSSGSWTGKFSISGRPGCYGTPISSCTTGRRKAGGSNSLARGSSAP
jgi:Protein of unknown function (DUF3179)